MISGLSTILKSNPVLTILLIAHFLADFHLQSQVVADRKSSEIKYLGIHLIWVAVPLIIAVVGIPKLWFVALAIFFSHALLDYFKLDIAKLLRLKKTGSFVLDQLLHLLIIVLLSFLTKEMTLPSWISPTILNLCLFLTLITKPTNIAFRIFFQRFQPDEVEKMDTIPGAGATIGLLERIVMGICIIFGQFASIGLVFTAKSIARYNKISESPAFAEYYLIGSLFSILSTLLVAWICFF